MRREAEEKNALSKKCSSSTSRNRKISTNYVKYEKLDIMQASAHSFYIYIYTCLCVTNTNRNKTYTLFHTYTLILFSLLKCHFLFIFTHSYTQILTLTHTHIQRVKQWQQHMTANLSRHQLA